MDGLAEFNLGAFLLQPALAPELAGCEGICVNFSVKDASAEQQKFAKLAGYVPLYDNPVGVARLR